MIPTLSMDAISDFISQMMQVSIHQPSAGAIVALALAVLLLAVSGFCSASEIAYFSLSPSQMQLLEMRKLSSDERALSLLEDKERLLATILITNNFVNVTIIMLCNYFFMKVFEFHSAVAEFVILTVVLTFILLLFGEIIPKIFSTEKALAVCRFASAPLAVCQKVFSPFSRVLLLSTSRLNKRFQHHHHNIGVKELSQALELTDKQEIAKENGILERIIRFGGETTSEVMTSRVDMVFLDMKDSYSLVLKCVRDNSYSRIPVCQDNVDTIKGILYVKDLLPYLDKEDTFDWQSLLRPAKFVPETQKIDELLKEFQKEKVHIAIVVDEFGGTSGLVTMEDIIEEIVGEIQDEYDDDEKPYKKLSDRCWIFPAKTLRADFFSWTGLDEDVLGDSAPDTDTLAGILLEVKGDFPKVGEHILFGLLDFEVLSMDKKRILNVKVSLMDPPTAIS